MKTKHAVLIAVAVGCLGFAAGEESMIRIPYRAVGDSALLIGELRLPLGEEVTVRGKLRRDLKDGDNFDISELNGKSLDRSVQIRGLESWPDGTEATIVGSEEATIMYRYRIRSASSDARPTPRQMAFNYFVPVEVVSPSGLKLSNDEAKYGRQSKSPERKLPRGGTSRWSLSPRWGFICVAAIFQGLAPLANIFRPFGAA